MISANFLDPISDHLPNFVLIKTCNIQKNTFKKCCRNLSNFNKSDFINGLTNIKLLQQIQEATDFNTKYNIFHNYKEINKHAPSPTRSKEKLKHFQKPWSLTLF